MSEIKVKNYIDRVQLKKDIAYSLTDLSNAMQEQASLRAHYGELSAYSAKQVDDLKIVLEVTESKAYRVLRDHYVTEKVKITEALLEKEVAVDPQVIRIKRALNEAKQVAAIAKTTYEAFGDRKDMLVQHGAKDREEMKGELRMRAATAAIEGAGDRAMSALKRVRGED